MRFVVVAAATAVVIAVAILVFSRGEKSIGRPIADATLVLSDLPAGYTVGDDSGCGALTPEGRPPRLDSFLGSRYPSFCHCQLERYAGDEPHVIESAIVLLDSEDTASRMLSLVPELSRYIMGTSEQLAAEPFAFGEGAVAMRFPDINSGRPSVVIAWRSAAFLNLIRVSGLDEPRLTEYVRELATVQQERGRLTAGSLSRQSARCTQ